MKKDINYYMSLKYPVKLVEFEEKDGGGFEASIPLLGKFAFIGYGETVDEALKNLEEVKRLNFEHYLEKGITIKEPATSKEREYTGKFLLRIPSSLHRSLAMGASANNVSLNQYCLYLLGQQSLAHEIKMEVARANSLDAALYGKVSEYSDKEINGNYDRVLAEEDDRYYEAA